MLKISVLNTCLKITNLRFQLHLPGVNELTHRSLDPGESGGSVCNFKNAVFNLVLLISISRSYDNALRWMLQDPTNGRSASLWVMLGAVGFRKLPEPVLTQICVIIGFTRPQWVWGLILKQTLNISFDIVFRLLSDHLFDGKSALVLVIDDLLIIPRKKSSNFYKFLVLFWGINWSISNTFLVELQWIKYHGLESTLVMSVQVLASYHWATSH